MNEELNYIQILPEIVLSIFGTLVMLIDPVLPAGNNRRSLGWLAFIGAMAAIAASLYQKRAPGVGWFGMVRVDTFSIFFHVLVIAISAVIILASFEYLEYQQMRIGEYYGLILFGTVGMALMSSAIELVLIFIALEISSISSYVLAGLRRRVASSTESALKYFLLGSFATAFFLYGVALIFGATGSTSIYAISDSLRSAAIPPLAYLALALMFVGIGFKVASAPFHVWTPDVYEGSPAPVVGWMSTGPKAAAFAVLLRILFGAMLSASHAWVWLIWVSAVLSMTIGNVGALLQNNVKRMLAYSSIAHAGYLLVAFAARNDVGVAAVIFYVASYAAMNVGGFAVVSHFARAGERYVNIEDYAGLGRRSPLLALTLTVFLLSLIGVPLTGGFFAKFYVFNAALKSNLVWLTIIGVVNTAIAAYYYLRLIVVMYMSEPHDQERLSLPVPVPLAIALLISVVATLYLGLQPGPVLNYATQGAHQLITGPPPTQGATLR